LPQIVIIAAVAEKNRVIGNGKDLPWHIPEDMRRFKALTTGHPLIMGRRTFESIIHQYGRVLPDRRNIVITSRGMLPGYPDIETYGSVEEALDAVADAPRAYIGGGGTIYEQLLPKSDRLDLTLIEGDYEGDTYFPPYEHLIGPVFEKTHEEPYEGFRFVVYERCKK
jgi:dihydrofolate reductase